MTPLNFGIGEDAWEYYGQSSKQNDGSLSKSTQSFHSRPNDQTQIILLWTHYAKTQLSEKVLSTGKSGRKEKNKMTAASWMYSFTVAMSGEDLSTWSLGVKNYLMALTHSLTQSQSINLLSISKNAWLHLAGSYHP